MFLPVFCLKPKVLICIPNPNLKKMKKLVLVLLWFIPAALNAQSYYYPEGTPDKDLFGNFIIIRWIFCMANPFCLHHSVMDLQAALMLLLQSSFC
jgi:hypothetical protein